MDITLRMSDHALTARAAAAAGIVLLQNKNRTLPLLPQEDGAPLPVAVFGVKQLQTPAFDKTMTPWRSIGVLDGLAASETVRPDALLARKYRTWAVEHPEGGEMPLTNLDFGALRHDCAAAVVVIGRTPETGTRKMTGRPGRTPQTSAPLNCGSSRVGGVRMPSCAMRSGPVATGRAPP